MKNGTRHGNATFFSSTSNDIERTRYLGISRSRTAIVVFLVMLMLFLDLVHNSRANAHKATVITSPCTVWALVRDTIKAQLGSERFHVWEIVADLDGNALE